MRKRKVTAYDENSRMGEGDPLRMAGLELKTPKSTRNMKAYKKRKRDPYSHLDKYEPDPDLYFSKVPPARFKGY